MAFARINTVLAKPTFRISIKFTDEPEIKFQIAPLLRHAPAASKEVTTLLLNQQSISDKSTPSQTNTNYPKYETPKIEDKFSLPPPARSYGYPEPKIKYRTPLIQIPTFVESVDAEPVPFTGTEDPLDAILPDVERLHQFAPTANVNNKQAIPKIFNRETTKYFWQGPNFDDDEPDSGSTIKYRAAKVENLNGGKNVLPDEIRYVIEKVLSEDEEPSAEVKYVYLSENDYRRIYELLGAIPKRISYEPGRRNAGRAFSNKET